MAFEKSVYRIVTVNILPLALCLRLEQFILFVLRRLQEVYCGKGKNCMRL